MRRGVAGQSDGSASCPNASASDPSHGDNRDAQPQSLRGLSPSIEESYFVSFRSPLFFGRHIPVSLPSSAYRVAAMFRTRLLRETERLINRNPHLYGPGPVARLPSGIGAMDPLKGLVMCASQGMAVALAGAFFYKFFIGDPGIQRVEDYYKENPPR